MSTNVSQGMATIVNPITPKSQSPQIALDVPHVVNQSTPQTRKGRVGATGFLSREQIIDAVQHCFDEGGYDAVTIRAIARHLSCAVGSIYRYFPDKRSLLLACAEDHMSPVLESLKSETTSIEPSVTQYLQIVSTHRQLYLLWFWLEESLPSMIAQIIQQWGNIIESRSIAEQYWMQIHGMVLMNRSTWQILNTIDIPQPLSLQDENETNLDSSHEIEIVVPDAATRESLTKITAAAIKLNHASNPISPSSSSPVTEVETQIEDVTLL